MSDTLELLRTALQDRYALERQVGEGGMAFVYRAEDLKHHRPVAIKVLKPELSANIGAERFLREVELAARLQHPHVVPVYDSGATEKSLYYVMPFIEGESLRDRLEREKTIPLGEALRLTREAASALHYAHEHGVVHRDIKPENIMLSGGHAVVTDFGIARAAAQPMGVERLTGLGMVIGTPAYMSPEQATADDVDTRSDQYSLACVFYEMVTGRQPFSGKTMQALIASHITGPRPKLSEAPGTVAPPAISSAIDAVLARALSPDRDQRYPDVMQFADALEQAGRQAAEAGRPRWWMAAAALLIAVVAGGGAWMLRGTSTGLKAGAERIAILPFTVTGGGDATLGEGMVNLLNTNLGVVKEIQTVDPQTVFVQWRKRGGPGGVDLAGALDVARASGASAALTGSVTNAGSRVRLAATLYALDGSQLGTATTEGAADSVLALVDDLSARLVREIWRSREPVPSLNVAGVTTSSLPALREYLAGEQVYRLGLWDSAQASFRRATEADSTFALAQYRLAMAYGWGGGYNNAAASKASALAEQYSDRLPPRERTLVRAYRMFQQGNVAAADTMRAFLATHPGDPDAWYLLGESMFHSREVRPLPPDSLVKPFEQVLAIDSTLTAALIHPLELAIAYGDSVRFERYLELLGAAATPATVDMWRWMGQVARADSIVAPDSTVRRFLTGFSGVSALSQGLIRNTRATPAEIVRFFEQVNSVAAAANDPRLREVPFVYGSALVTLGRLDDTRTYATSLMATHRENAYFLQALPILTGYAGPDAARAYAARGPEVLKREGSNPYVTSVFTTAALHAGDRATAKRLLQPWVNRDTAGLAPDARNMLALLQAQAGWLAIQEGDTAGGLKRIEAGLGKLVNRVGPPLKDPVRFEYARTLAARPATRDRGVAMLEHGFEFPLMQPATNLALGRIYEAEGRKDKAIQNYQQVTRLWADADTTLQPRVAEAREAIARLTAEKPAS